MIRALALCAALLAPPVSAQVANPGDPYEWVDALPPFPGDNLDVAYAHLSQALRQGHQLGYPHPDWGMVFAMLSDLYRNDRGNAGYALRLADEGLEVSVPWGDEAAVVRSMLMVSRSYALADLGRFEEAVVAGRLAEPFYREGMGQEAGDAYAAEIAEWAKGAKTDMNTSPLELAREAMVAAGQALDRGEYGRAITLASRAVLPEGTGLDPAEVRRLQAETGMVTGRALYHLNRLPEALEVFRRASEAALDRDATDATGAPVWRQPLGEGGVRIAALYLWYGRAAMDYDIPDLAAWAYAIADAATTDPDMRVHLRFAQVRLMQIQGDEAGSVRLLREVAASERARGNEAMARHAEFYIAMSLKRTHISLTALKGLAEAAESVAQILTDQNNPEQAAFFLTEAAAYLVNYGETNATALDFARRALAIRARALTGSQDNEVGVEGAARDAGFVVDILLFAASSEAQALPGIDCDMTQGGLCPIIVTTAPPTTTP